jgi:membrane-associated phospholipid phosphatase
MTQEIRAPRDVRFWIAIAALLFASVLFIVLAASVATTAPLLKEDLQVSVWLHTNGNAVFTAFLLAITQLHSPAGIGVLALIVAILLWRNGDRWWVLSLAVAVGGGMLLNTFVKGRFERVRPTWDDPLLTLASSSFPSGHTAGATLFYGFLAAYMVWRMKAPWPRALAVAACALMVVLVGFSRIYLGVHYLTDVLAAASLATVWLVLSLIAVRAYAKRHTSSGG